jgi:hypothetical protein
MGVVIGICVRYLGVPSLVYDKSLIYNTINEHELPVRHIIYIYIYIATHSAATSSSSPSPN